MMMSKKSGIYIHIPYCLSKCNYCGFLSRPISDGMDYEEINKYVDYLIKEIKIRSSSSKNSIFDTIYFGGGTPSLLSPFQIDRIMRSIYSNYYIDKNPEITIEANPETLDCAKLKDYRSLNINRLSMGVQSFNDDVLKVLGRIHSSNRAIKEFDHARKAGFDNISIDLMFSIPNTSLDDVISDIDNAIRIAPEHISFYSLQLEEGTKFFNEFESGKLKEVPDEVDRIMYHRGCDLLNSSGYNQYEISNFSKDEEENGISYRSRHNSKYWNMSSYMGFGLGASSYFFSPHYVSAKHSGNKRTRNHSSYRKYRYALEMKIEPFEEEILNTYSDDQSEAIFTGLRRSEGITYEEIGMQSREEFEEVYKDSVNELSGFILSGHVNMDSSGIRLTKEGIDISNKIMALFV